MNRYAERIRKLPPSLVTIPCALSAKTPSLPANRIKDAKAAGVDVGGCKGGFEIVKVHWNFWSLGVPVIAISSPATERRGWGISSASVHTAKAVARRMKYAIPLIDPLRVR